MKIFEEQTKNEPQILKRPSFVPINAGENVGAIRKKSRVDFFDDKNYQNKSFEELQNELAKKSQEVR